MRDNRAGGIAYIEASKIIREEKRTVTMISSFDGTQLYLNKEVSDDNVCVAVIAHGLCEHQGRYDYLSDLFHKGGIGTYRFDHRGHGRSEGEHAHYDDFNVILDDLNVVVDMAIAENPDKHVFLVGHSMGGFAVSLYGARYKDKRLAGVVTSGAVTHGHIRGITDLSPSLDPLTQFPSEPGAPGTYVPEVVESYASDPLRRRFFTAGLCFAMHAGWDWFRESKRDFAYPVLMLHGEDDKAASVQDTYDFFGGAASTDRQMKIYGGLQHSIFNEYCRDEVIGDAIRWILARA